MPPLHGRSELGSRLAALGRTLGEREAAQAGDLATARSYAEQLHAEISAALGQFHAAAADAGASHLAIQLSDIRTDDKHLRAVEFDLSRGRHRAIVTSKSRGEVTLVGPFRSGKTEGPCRTFPFDANEEIEAALGDFLERFLEEAATP